MPKDQKITKVRQQVTILNILISYSDQAVSRNNDLWKCIEKIKASGNSKKKLTLIRALKKDKSDLLPNTIPSLQAKQSECETHLEKLLALDTGFDDRLTEIDESYHIGSFMGKDGAWEIRYLWDYIGDVYCNHAWLDRENEELTEILAKCGERVEFTPVDEASYRTTAPKERSLKALWRIDIERFEEDSSRLYDHYFKAFQIADAIECATDQYLFNYALYHKTIIEILDIDDGHGFSEQDVLRVKTLELFKNVVECFVDKITESEKYHISGVTLDDLDSPEEYDINIVIVELWKKQMKVECTNLGQYPLRGVISALYKELKWVEDQNCRVSEALQKKGIEPVDIIEERIKRQQKHDKDLFTSLGTIRRFKTTLRDQGKNVKARAHTDFLETIKSSFENEINDIRVTWLTIKKISEFRKKKRCTKRNLQAAVDKTERAKYPRKTFGSERV